MAKTEKDKAEKPKKTEAKAAPAEAKKKAPAAEAKADKAEAKGEKHAEKHADKHAEEAKKEGAHKAHHSSTKSREELKCKMKGCKRSYRAKGYCQPHYREWRHGKFGIARYKTCSTTSCFKPMVINRHGLCEEHYQSYYVKGIEKPKVAAPAKPAEVKEAASA